MNPLLPPVKPPMCSLLCLAPVSSPTAITYFKPFHQHQNQSLLLSVEPPTTITLFESMHHQKQKTPSSPVSRATQCFRFSRATQPASPILFFCYHSRYHRFFRVSVALAASHQHKLVHHHRFRSSRSTINITDLLL